MMAKPWSGNREDVGFDIQGCQELFLFGLQGPGQLPLPADGQYQRIDELGGHHESRRSCGLALVPAGDGPTCFFDVLAHGALHQAPDKKRDQQHHAQHLDALVLFQKDAVDDQRVLERI